jgi:hypothetical protein
MPLFEKSIFILRTNQGLRNKLITALLGGEKPWNGKLDVFMG